MGAVNRVRGRPCAQCNSSKGRGHELRPGAQHSGQERGKCQGHSWDPAWQAQGTARSPLRLKRPSPVLRKVGDWEREEEFQLCKAL